MKTIPLWTDQFPRPTGLPVSPLPEQVDVAVVGGGYTGLSAARTLAKSGASVAVLEQGHIGSGASSVNGGQLSPGLKKATRAILQQYGPELGREFWQASVEAVHCVEQIVREEKIECDLHMGGSLALAYRPEHYETLARKAEWLARRLGYEQVTLAPRERLREEIGSDAFFGGLLDHLGGSLQPAKFVYGLARAAARAGAVLCENTEVQAINRRPGDHGFLVTTGQGQLKAGQVLVATNGYTGSLVPELRRRIFPVGSYMITTEPLPPELQQELNPKNHVFYDTKWFINYFRLTPDGRATMGGRNNLSPDLDLVQSAGILHKTMLRIFPQLRGVPITHSWSGRLGLTFDLMPHIGRVDGIYYAFGYCGHGVTIATYLGREVAQLMAGQIPRSPFAEISHPTYFFYRGRPWFLPLVAAYYRVLDRFS